MGGTGANGWGAADFASMIAGSIGNLNTVGKPWQSKLRLSPASGDSRPGSSPSRVRLAESEATSAFQSWSRRLSLSLTLCESESLAHCVTVTFHSGSRPLVSRRRSPPDSESEASLA
eukprot:3936947-Rhodomonas_salina.1